MKLTVTLYRTTSIETRDLISIAGFDAKFGLIDGNAAMVLQDGTPLTEKRLNCAIREQFNPFPPRFKIFYHSNLTAKMTTVGIEAMSFDLLEPQTPISGIVHSDPIEAKDADRIDGALESELNRLGLGADFENYGWKMAYEIKGEKGN